MTDKGYYLFHLQNTKSNIEATPLVHLVDQGRVCVYILHCIAILILVRQNAIHRRQKEYVSVYKYIQLF